MSVKNTAEMKVNDEKVAKLLKVSFYVSSVILALRVYSAARRLAALYLKLKTLDNIAI